MCSTTSAIMVVGDSCSIATNSVLPAFQTIDGSDNWQFYEKPTFSVLILLIIHLSIIICGRDCLLYTSLLNELFLIPSSFRVHLPSDTSFCPYPPCIFRRILPLQSRQYQDRRIYFSQYRTYDRLDLQLYRNQLLYPLMQKYLRFANLLVSKN